MTVIYRSEDTVLVQWDLHEIHLERNNLQHVNIMGGIPVQFLYTHDIANSTMYNATKSV